MHILLIVPEYPPYHIGGGGLVYSKLAQHFLRLGHKISVVYGYYPTKHGFERIHFFCENGIDFYQVPEIPCPKKFPFLKTAMPAGFFSSLHLSSLIRTINPDVANIHGYGLMFINQTAKILKKLGIPYAFSLHGFPQSQNNASPLIRSMYSWYDKNFTLPTCQNAAAITCVSNYIESDPILSPYRKKTHTILNGLDEEDYPTTALSKKQLLFEHRIPDTGTIIFSAGRLAQMKGFQLLIEKLPHILATSTIHYIIAGRDDGFETALRALVDHYQLQNHVHFLGWQDQNVVNAFLQQSDIIALPSLFDPCPIFAFDAMAYNKLVITTFAGGIKEIYQNYPHTIDINSADFFDVLSQAIQSKSYAKLAPIDLSSYSWSRVAKQYLHILQHIASPR